MNDEKKELPSMPHIIEMVSKVLIWHGIKPGTLGWYELLNCGAAAAQCMIDREPISPNRITMEFAAAAGTTQLNAWQRMRRALRDAKWDVTVREAIYELGMIGVHFR